MSNKSILSIVIIQIKKKQNHIRQALSSFTIYFEEVDVSDPSLDNEKNFMMENSKTGDKNSQPKPPQLFNDSEYCGVRDFGSII